MLGAWIASDLIDDLSQEDLASLEVAIAKQINDDINNYGTKSSLAVEWARRDLLVNDGRNLVQALCRIPDLASLNPESSMAALRGSSEFQALLSEGIGASDPAVTSSSDANEVVESPSSSVELVFPVLAVLVLIAVLLLWGRDHLF